MFVKTVLLFALFTGSALFAGVRVEIGSDNFDEMFAKLSNEKTVRRIIHAPKVERETLTSSESYKNSDSSKRAKLQTELQYLMQLLSYMDKSTTAQEVAETLRREIFKSFATKNEEYSFVFKLVYPNTLSSERGYADLQREVSRYILKNYGLSSTKTVLKLKNMDIDSSTIRSRTLGTLEPYPPKSFENGRHFTKENVTITGVASYLFYPFAIEKRKVVRESMDRERKKAEKIQSFYKEIREGMKVDDIPFSLPGDDSLKIGEFLTSYKKEKRVDSVMLVQRISTRVQKLRSVAKQLFSRYPKCKTLGCIEREIKRKLESMSVIKKTQEYTYDTILSNDVDYEDALSLALIKFKKFLKKNTHISSADIDEKISNESYTATQEVSDITPVVEYVEIVPFIENDRLGLHFEAKVSYESSSVCSQYVKSKPIFDPLTGLRFIRLKNAEGETLEVATTEVTNAVFKRVLPHAKFDRECKRTRMKNQPVNCLDFDEIDRFLEKLNHNSGRYSYRLLRCDEALFYATCGEKQAYCWGNTKNYEPFEFLRKSKYDDTLKKVASKKPNGLKLYDFCGNAAEYCMDKRGRYKTLTVNTRTLRPILSRRTFNDVNTIRVVREAR